MMEKITLNLEAVEAENVTFKLFGNKIEVIPVLTLEDQILLTIHYLNNYFDNSGELIPGTSTNYIGAEYALVLEIMDKYTNINIAEDKDVILMYWKNVCQYILNFPEFKCGLDRVVQDKKEELALEKSVGTVIDSLVTKVTDFIERLASINIDDEGLAKLKETAKELMSNIEQSPVAEIYKESSKQVQIDQAAKTVKTTSRKPRKSKKAE
jgi:hypothetical protein